MTAALISACNEALALIAKGSIASLNEGSIEADECNRFAGPLLEEMAEWTEWPEQIVRVTLALTTNDRPAEWLYAYAQPSDMADPIAIRQVEQDAARLPLGIPFQLPYQDAQPLALQVEGGKIYSNVETADLTYVKSTLEAADLRPLMRRAFVDELAARLATPVAKDAKMADRLAQKAEVSRARAIADAQNRSPRRAVAYVTEAEMAREGYGL